MKIRKILSLLLSVAYLNLSVNFSHCFGMLPDDHSVTQVEIPSFTNCPICGAKRDSKTRTILRDRFKSKQYTTACPGCGSYGITGKGRRRKILGYNTNSDMLSCRYCGCRNIHRNGKLNGIQQYKCMNCRISGQTYMTQKTNLQVWKQNFCKDCNQVDGFVSSKLISGTRDIYTNKRVKKGDKVKSILSDPNGFRYYCYTCKKCKDIILTTEQAKLVCAEYDRCLNLSNSDV